MQGKHEAALQAYEEALRIDPNFAPAQEARDGCPVSAIEYGRKSRGKPRYQCPEYQ